MSNDEDANRRSRDDPGMSSTAGSSSSIAAGVVVSGSSATANFNNLNQSIAGLEPEATPISTNVTAGIVARDHAQVTVHKHYHSQPCQLSATNNSTADQIQALLKNIHQNTWEKTAVDMRDSFKADKFPEPNFEVHPQMVESPCFYKGGHPDLVENDPTRPKTKRKPENVKQPKYKKDYKFTFEKLDVSSHRTFTVASLMEKIHEKKDKLGVLGVVAQAGAGKTTCMRRWARRTMTRSGMSKENQFTPDKESRFQMVHFLDMKSIPMSEISSLQEFLFKDLFENEESMKIAFEWLLQNQNKVAIFLDGLDQAQENITEQDMKAVGNHGKATCRSILCNLLTRNLLPGVRIIISSREHAASSLPEEAWISDVITLTGFSEDDAKKLFNAVTAPSDDSISTEEDEDASTDRQIKADCSQLVKSDSSVTETASVQDHLESNWDKLTKTSSSLLSFISIPVFLMFTAIVFNTFGQTPSSVTELLVKVFETLPFSVVIQKRKTLSTVIHKLKRLSHTGMEKRFVIFSSQDLTSHDLSKDDVQDLLLMVPRSRSLTHLIEGDNVFFFCHQILQEFLSACFVVEMTLKDFKVFVETCLNEYQWSVVIRFVCGLLFSSSEEVGKLLQISDKDKKQDILRQSLSEQLGSRKVKWRRHNHELELYATIYESNDDSVISLITEIKFEYPALSNDGAHLIGSLMARCKKKKFDSLKIRCCDLDNYLLRIMAKSIGYPKNQDKILTVKVGKNISVLMQRTAHAAYWLNQCTVSLDIKDKLGTQYLHYKCVPSLIDMEITGNRQIENILLDCLGYEESLNVEEYKRDITSIAKKFQVKVMDLVVSFKQFGAFMDKLKPLLHLHDLELRIHVVTENLLGIKTKNAVKQFAILKRSNVQIESFRLMFLDGDIPLHYAAPCIQNLSKARVKQFFIVHNSYWQRITCREEQKCAANCSGTELTFVRYYNLDDLDPWKSIYDSPFL